MARLPAAALVVLALGATACTDFASPAELTKPTILAVTAEPPVVAPGGHTALAVAVADATGPLTGLPTRWSLIETYRGVPPMGTLSGTTYTAPDPLPTLPAGAAPVDTIQLEIDTAVGTLVAVKVVPVVSVATANPTITGLTVGDQDGLAGPVTIARAASLPLTLTTEPAPGEDARFAWYSSAGLIEKYQSNPTELVAADDAGGGWLFVVMRDGKGGVAWRGVQVTVE